MLWGTAREFMTRHCHHLKHRSSRLGLFQWVTFAICGLSTTFCSTPPWPCPLWQCLQALCGALRENQVTMTHVISNSQLHLADEWSMTRPMSWWGSSVWTTPGAWSLMQQSNRDIDLCWSPRCWSTQAAKRVTKWPAFKRRDCQGYVNLTLDIETVDI